MDCLVYHILGCICYHPENFRLICIMEMFYLLTHPQCSSPYVRIAFTILLYSDILFSNDNCDLLPISRLIFGSTFFIVHSFHVSLESMWKPQYCICFCSARFFLVVFINYWVPIWSLAKIYMLRFVFVFWFIISVDIPEVDEVVLERLTVAFTRFLLVLLLL